MSQPLLSVVIPCFNGGKWIAEAVDSVLVEQLCSVEVVVVDDGSTDESAAILERFGTAVVVIRQTNMGVVKARRVGVQNASGRYIKFLDADDLLPAGALRQLLAAIESYPDELLIGRSVEISEDGRMLGSTMYNIGYLPEHLSLVKKEFLLTQATSSSLWLIPREVFFDHSLFAEDGVQMGEEFGFCVRLIRSGLPIRYLGVVVSYVRVHEASTRLSRNVDESRHLKQIEEVDKAAAFINHEMPGHSPEALRQIARLCWSRGRSCLRIGCRRASQRYFELAKRLDPEIAPVGSRVYRLLCMLSGPRVTEAAMQSAKKWLSRPGDHE